MALFRRRRDDVVEEPVAVIPAGPGARGEVAQRLRAAAPDSGPLLAESLLPAVRFAIRREPDAAIDVAESKFGGAPDLPVGTFWPNWTPPGGEKRYLQFFAQVDLADATAAAPGDWNLPASGLLSFFADFDRERGVLPGPGGVAVHHSPADSQFTRCSLRLVPLPTAQLHPLGVWSWSQIANGSAVAAFDGEEEANLRRRVPPRYAVSARHQLGGHAAGTDGAALLLQFDSEPALELAWGPGGAPARLVWTVPAAGLAAGDWSGVRLSLIT